MGRETWKNDVKTLFFIFNTFSVVGVGLMLFSIGVGTGVLKEMKPWNILEIVIGLVYIAFGFSGYCSAIMDNQKMLHFYTTVICVRSISYVIELVYQSKVVAAGNKGADGVVGVPPEDQLAAMILITIITMLTTLLSFTLAVNAPRSPRAAVQGQGTTAMAPIKPSV